MITIQSIINSCYKIINTFLSMFLKKNDTKYLIFKKDDKILKIYIFSKKKKQITLNVVLFSEIYLILFKEITNVSNEKQNLQNTKNRHLFYISLLLNTQQVHHIKGLFVFESFTSESFCKTLTRLLITEYSTKYSEVSLKTIKYINFIIFST